MPLSKEQLLNPRYKVIADYPGNEFGVGLILEKMDKTAAWLSPCNNINIGMRIESAEKYPHLFQKLEWWMGRKPGEMPEYLLMKHQSQKVKKAARHFVKATHGFGFVDEEGSTKSYVNYLPATAEEYQQYRLTQNSKQ